MGFDSAFFAANDTQLFQALPGWKRPNPLLEEPVPITIFDPFAGAQRTVMTRIDPVQPQPQTTASLRIRLDGLSCVWWKNITNGELPELEAILTGAAADTIFSETNRGMIGPDGANVSVYELRPELSRALQSLPESEPDRVSELFLKLGLGRTSVQKSEQCKDLMRAMQRLAQTGSKQEQLIFLAAME